MISCPPPAGASMCYRLDPYSLEVVTTTKPKSMHDVVEPTILFYHRKSGAAGGSSGKAGSPQQQPSSTTVGKGSKKNSARFSTKQQQQELAVTPSPVPTKKKMSGGVSSPSSSSGSATPAVRYITLTTQTSPRPLTLIAPFRVAPGDAVVFQALNGGEHFGVVAHVHDANYCPPNNNSSPTTKRLIRKARSVDQEAQCANTRSISNVRSVVDAVLKQQCPGGFGPGSLGALEWQLDKSLLYIQMMHSHHHNLTPTDSASLPAVEGQQDVHSLYKALVAALQCEVQILLPSGTSSSSSTSSCHSPHSSSPALSDCGASSVGEAPSSCDF